jgi:SagB-type dehydrogenase family enzyme
MGRAAVVLTLVISLSGVIDAKEGKKMQLFSNVKESVVQLPAPLLHGGMSLEETLAKRESTRNFSSKPLTPSEISQVLWAAQGITRNWGGRATPSAGALYPLELYLVLREGLFHYMPRTHQLIRVSDQNVIDDLSSAALGQECVSGSPAIVVITAVYERMERKYGRRGERYVKIEAGHAAQNIHLQAVSLGLGSVPVGAFNDDQVRKVLSLPANHEPLYLIPLGHIKK